MLRAFLSLLAVGILSSQHASAQTAGCTNIQAVNYNPSALIDDGSCTVFESVVSYNANLNIPFSIGTGISNERFAKVQHGPIEFGIKANRRFIEDLVPVNDNFYLADAGYAPTSFSDPTPDVGIGTWDFLFSFDLGPYTFSDLRAVVEIDFDPINNGNQAAQYTLDVSFVMGALGLSNQSIRQESENLGFNYWQLIAGPTALLYDPLSPGVYDFTIRVENEGGYVLGSVDMIVVVDDPIDGCTNPDACNFSLDANVDDTTCVFPDPVFGCAECEHDFNNNGICDELEVFGCTYPSALNYNPEATSDNGSCTFECDQTPCNRADFNNNGIVDLPDLLTFLSLYGASCN
jgi:hypothetical protein